MKSNREEVFAVLDAERRHQQSRVTNESIRPTKDLESYIVFIDSYLHELKEAMTRNWGPSAEAKALPILRKLTALGVAAMEEHGAVPRVVS